MAACPGACLFLAFRMSSLVAVVLLHNPSRLKVVCGCNLKLIAWAALLPAGATMMHHCVP